MEPVAFPMSTSSDYMPGSLLPNAYVPLFLAWYDACIWRQLSLMSIIRFGFALRVLDGSKHCYRWKSLQGRNWKDRIGNCPSGMEEEGGEYFTLSVLQRRQNGKCAFFSKMALLTSLRENLSSQFPSRKRRNCLGLFRSSDAVPSHAFLSDRSQTCLYWISTE